jgi:U3 small nucleolar RNA-associated protein 21
LQLAFITRPQTPEVITASTTWTDKVVAAWGAQEPGQPSGIWIFKRGKKVGEIPLPPRREAIRQLLVFGSWIIGCSETIIEVWKSTTLEHYTTLYPQQSQAGVELTGGITTVPTYLNKIFAGRADGTVEIWNVSTGKLLYTILPSSSDLGGVTALQAAPALHHLAIAHESGMVAIHNVRTDKQLLTVNRAGGSKTVPVTSISFRTDGLGAGDDGRKDGVMATASTTTGDVTFWDLNKGGRKMGVLRGAHSPPSSSSSSVSVPGGVTKIEFLAGQAVLLSSGLDNALKSWIFDDVPFSPIPRILHERRGHAAPVSKLMFLPPAADGTDDTGKWLLSASQDRSLWGWSLRRDGQSTELSQGHIRKKAKKMGALNASLASDGSPSLEDLKAPRITCIACSMNRDGGIGAMPGEKQIWTPAGKGKSAKDATISSTTGWESVVTGHENNKFARTWFWGRKRAGRWIFETGDGSTVTCVAISPCGTFALVGSAAGGIDMFNLQSGIHRQRFPPRLTTTQAKRLKAQQMEVITEPRNSKMKFLRGIGKHTKAVTGVQVDALNRTVISCGEDGKVKFWEFNNGLLLHELDWSQTSINRMVYHRPSDLIALSCNDGAIRVVDIETRKLVRELWGCKGTVEELTFSNDGRWIITASADSVIRVWDLPTGHLIEALRFHSKPKSIAFSNTGEFLAIAHEDSVGIQIWTNRTLFTYVPTRQISSTDIVDMDAPTASGEGGQSLVEAALTTTLREEEETDEIPMPLIDQLSDDLLTLSLVPKSQWQTLLHLDVIRQRNKPKEPPKAPEKAPFFLPSMIATSKTEQHQPQALIAPSDQQTEEMPAPVSRISNIPNPSTAHTSTFTSLLRSEDMERIVAHLASLPPSSADLAIRTLDTSPPYSELVRFLNALTVRLKQKRDYELVEAWVSVFLRCHGDILTESVEVREALDRWREQSMRESRRIDDMVGFCRGVGNWIGGVI